MGAFPSVLTSFVTGERPFVVSAIGCAILATRSVSQEGLCVSPYWAAKCSSPE
jgi:hypothetical protein